VTRKKERLKDIDNKIDVLTSEQLKLNAKIHNLEVKRQKMMAKNLENTLGSGQRNRRMDMFNRSISLSARAPRSNDLNPAHKRLVVNMMLQGKKIQAIKLVRDRTGYGLIEAKAYVEDLML